MAMLEKITQKTIGRARVIGLNNPPVNAGSHDLRAQLLAAIQAFSEDPQVDYAILMGEGSNFMAGSDIKEFSAPLQAPQLPQVIAALENCPKPIIAAIQGLALGGGCELALACDARIALQGAQFGLPEITLGIIPGAGGTQRLPRLIGIMKTLQYVCTGQRISADEAFALGIITQLVPDQLLAHALRCGADAQGKKNCLRDLPAPTVEITAFTAAKEHYLKRGKHRPAMQQAIASVHNAALLSIDAGLLAERAMFQDLRVSEEAAALRYQFFAERKVYKTIAAVKGSPAQVHSVAIIGAGTMGSGIAIDALNGGYQVILLDQNDTALQQGRQRIEDYYARRVHLKAMDAPKQLALLANLQLTTQWSTIASVDLVIEAVFEDLAVKQAVFTEIDRVVKSQAILASNTSYLDLDEMAQVLHNPSRLVGLHFFSPAYAMKLIEVVNAQHSADDALATALSFAKAIGKLPVITTNAFGFVGNRMYAAYRRQCEFMLEEGSYPDEIDAALESFGFAMGPFAVADMSGLDIAWRMRKSQAQTRKPQDRYVTIADQLCVAGRLGKKSGQGYYTYHANGTVDRCDPFVRQIIEQESRQKNIMRQSITAEQIQQRVLLTLFNEAALLLAERVITNPSDCDVVLVNGYGFPRWRGGVLFWGLNHTYAWMTDALDELERQSGQGFVRSDPQFLWAAQGEV